MAWTGRASTPWEMASEIVALALNTHAAKTFDDTGATIDPARRYKEKAHMRCRNGLLGDCFAHTRHDAGAVRPNKEHV